MDAIKSHLNSIFKGVLKLAGILLAVYGFLTILYISGMLVFGSGCPRNERCMNVDAKMKVELSGTRAESQIRLQSKGTLEGFCQDEVLKKYFDKIPKQFVVECKDTQNSYTIIARDPKNPDWGNSCVDGKYNFISSTTKIFTHDGVECK